jgi:hypothetical protein
LRVHRQPQRLDRQLRRRRRRGNPFLKEQVGRDGECRRPLHEVLGEVGGAGFLGLREDPGSLREALGLVDERWTACRIFSESGSGGGKGIGA